MLGKGIIRTGNEVTGVLTGWSDGKFGHDPSGFRPCVRVFVSQASLKDLEPLGGLGDRGGGEAGGVDGRGLGRGGVGERGAGEGVSVLHSGSLQVESVHMQPAIAEERTRQTNELHAGRHTYNKRQAKMHRRSRLSHFFLRAHTRTHSHARAHTHAQTHM